VTEADAACIADGQTGNIVTDRKQAMLVTQSLSRASSPAPMSPVNRPAVMDAQPHRLNNRGSVLDTSGGPYQRMAVHELYQSEPGSPNYTGSAVREVNGVSVHKRIVQPPGGASSISFGGGADAPSYRQYVFDTFVISEGVLSMSYTGVWSMSYTGV